MMKYSSRIQGIAKLVLGFSLLSSYAFARDIEHDLEQAEQVYLNQRSDAATLQHLISNLAQLAEEADQPAQKYDAMVLESRAIYFQGMQLPQNNGTAEQRKVIFGRGRDVAVNCIALGIQYLGDNRAECYYTKAINLGRWGEANGIFESLGRRYELRNAAIDTIYKRSSAEEAVETTPVRDAQGQIVMRYTKNGRPGIEFEAYGANRTLAWMYYRLPALYPGLHGDKARSEQLLREGVAAFPNHSLNILYLAYVLISRRKQPEARSLLDRMLTQDPLHFDNLRVPETVAEFQEARTLRDSLGG